MRTKTRRTGFVGRWTVVTLLAVMAAFSTAFAASWKTADGGSADCTKLNQDGVCWLTGISENSAAINIRSCGSWSITVYGSGSVMPEACTSSDCSTSEALLANNLTGSSPNTFMTSEIAWDYVRINYTSGTPTIAIKCGR